VLLLTSLCGLGLGLVGAWYLPEKYTASATLQSAMLLGKEAEEPQVLAEKMSSPTYYSPVTFSACGLTDQADPGFHLVKLLQPKKQRASTFVTVSFRATSPGVASACLEAVLADVGRRQNDIVQPQLNVASLELKKNEERLKSAEEFLAQLTTSGVTEKSVASQFNDARFSASSLMVTTLAAKQSEITELRNSIQKTRLALTPPQTQAPSFVTPIYASEIKTWPKPALFTALGLILGAMLGLVSVLTLTFCRKVRQRLLPH
jgi:uncharacterized protein involved in exopolysaccharide biosynthesis